MMYENFKTELKGKLEERGYIVKDHLVQKNNVTLEGFSILTDSECNVSPTFYYQDLYDTGSSIGNVVAKVLLATNKDSTTASSFLDFMKSFSLCKKFIYPCLIGRDNNTELLKNLPHVEYLDLAVIFKIIFPYKGSLASVMVSNHILQMWNIQMFELEEVARLNDLSETFICEDMFHSLLSTVKMYNEEERDMLLSLAHSDNCNMFVITNKRGINGAIALYTRLEMIKDLSHKLGTDLIIFPSSIHEIILVPFSENTNINSLRDMVRDINENEVEITDVLSSSVYLYSRATNTINML